MFTGLVREIATVTSYQNNQLSLKAQYIPKIGDSIAINGVCLTVVKLNNSGFTVELSPETTNTIVMENFQVNSAVHIEPAMQMNDRFEGHVVQGHVDGIGTVLKVEKFGNSHNFFIKIPSNIMNYMIPKGSIAIDGISLTINSLNELSENSVKLTIIPHTTENTLFKNYKIGSKVNIESDMFARYIENLILNREKISTNSNSNWDSVDNIMARY